MLGVSKIDIISYFCGLNVLMVIEGICLIYIIKCK